jgi:Acetyltransferases, including N-acetylases of ribosomal proteins
MKYFPKIVGERVYLSPISLEDAERYTDWLNDLQITRFLTLAAANVSLHGEKDAILELSKKQAYAIVEKGTDELLGNCGLFAVEHVHRSAEVGIFLGNQDKLGQGYGAEALRLLCDYGFNVLNLRSISLRTYAYNERAIACYRKVGFKDAGRLRKAHFYAGEYHDVLYMDLLSEELGPSVLPSASCR